MSDRHARLWLLTLAAAALAFAIGVPAAAPNGPSPDIVISEVYGAGGNTGSDYPADYVEIFNRSAATVSLDGMSLQYTSAAGTGTFGSFSGSTTILSGTVAPGQYVLVQAAGGSVPADITLLALMAATAGKVALVQGTTPLDCNTAASCAANGGDLRIIDLVGYGATANYFEGPGPALGATTTTSTRRQLEGCEDTDHNAVDFAASDQDPDSRNSAPNPCTAPPGDMAPTVTATNPANGSFNVDRDGSITITFSEPIIASDGAFELSCNGATVPFVVTSNAEGTTVTLDPSVTLPADAQCSVAVRAAFVSDQDTDDPPDHPAADHVLTFRTTGIAGLRIHDIQGRQHLSPYRDLAVAAVPGIVTARRSNGFYMQDPQPDADVRTSEGIFVFTGGAPPAVAAIGAPVSVSGRVSEFRPGCSPSCAPSSDAFGNLTTTEIVSPVIMPGAETGAIGATVVGEGGRWPPAVIIDNDTPDPAGDDPPLVSGDVESKSSPPGVTDPQDPTFDPEQDGLDFHESLEGMLVQINEAVAVAPTVDFSVSASLPRGSNSEIAVVADNGRRAGVRTPRGGVVVRALDSSLPQEYRVGDFNPERLILNDPIARDRGQIAPLVHTGGTFGGPIMAVVDYSFGNFKYLVLDWPAADPGDERRETTSTLRRIELSVATYNVENLDAVLDGGRIAAIAQHIVRNLHSPDILGLQEMQDLDGEGPLGPSGDSTFVALAAAILGAGGPSYDFRQIDPIHNADGGVPNGNIRVGLMFRTDRGLAFVDRPGGTALTPTEDDPAQRGAQLTFSPGRIEPANPVFTNSRKPLAGEFRFRGHTLFVVVNHLNSKGGDAPLMGRFQEPMRPSEIQRRGATLPAEDPQRGQAGVINAWVRRLLAADRRANVIVLGDMNDFDFSETSSVLERGGDSHVELVNLWRTLRQSERYSYLFQGNSQTLDHILVSPHLLLALPRLDPVRVNADFFDNASDHDPLIVRLALPGDDDDRKRDDDDDEEDEDEGEGEDDDGEGREGDDD